MRRKLLSVLVLFGMLLSAVAAAASPEQIERGRYLARAGNCAGCHTAPGGADFAGGRAVHSPFGTFYVPNITADRDTGIGRWSVEQFRQALQRGRRPDGSALYPACPYPNFTRVHAADIDAIYAYLRSLPAVRQSNPPHDLATLASLRPLMRVWQWLYFSPGEFRPDPAKSERWNRGAYLVEGLGHCSACHAERNLLGAEDRESSRGGLVQGWYAPSLYTPAEAGLQGWPLERAAALLRHGKAGDASTMGPMADVVFNSLQYLDEADILAMAEYLRSLPERPAAAPGRRIRLSPQQREAALALGSKVYGEHCRDCHGEAAQGSEVAPRLAGNRVLTMDDRTNLVQIIRQGGYPPSTQGDPRPFGMPPFHALSERELDAMILYLREQPGNP